MNDIELWSKVVVTQLPFRSETIIRLKTIHRSFNVLITAFPPECFKIAKDQDTKLAEFFKQGAIH